jgi:hypothetical protein
MDHIGLIQPRTVLDIGPGAGTWHNWYPAGEWTGVEIWEPYVERFNLRATYDHIIIGDAQTVDLGGPYDLGILGDVLEHTDDPLALYERVRSVCVSVLVQVPLGYWPQGEEEGNPYEVHRSSIYAEEVQNWPGAKFFYENDQIGLLIAEGRAKVVS